MLNKLFPCKFTEVCGHDSFKGIFSDQKEQIKNYFIVEVF